MLSGCSCRWHRDLNLESAGSVSVDCGQLGVCIKDEVQSRIAVEASPGHSDRRPCNHLRRRDEQDGAAGLHVQLRNDDGRKQEENDRGRYEVADSLGPPAGTRRPGVCVSRGRRA